MSATLSNHLSAEEWRYMHDDRDYRILLNHTNAHSLLGDSLY